MRELARALGAWVVGGSHHDRRRSRITNRGVVMDPSGAIAGVYEKRNPYGSERELGVASGARMCALSIRGWHVGVLVCVDFFSSVLLRSAPAPLDLIVVPSFSITKHPSPRRARAIWRHMAIARAYEFAAYVAISDWGPDSAFRGRRSAAVAGVAQPLRGGGVRLFRGVAGARFAVATLDPAALQSLRGGQRARGLRAAHARPALD